MTADNRTNLFLGGDTAVRACEIRAVRKWRGQAGPAFETVFQELAGFGTPPENAVPEFKGPVSGITFGSTKWMEVK